jgi:hypothetical protein
MCRLQCLLLATVQCDTFVQSLRQQGSVHTLFGKASLQCILQHELFFSKIDLALGSWGTNQSNPVKAYQRASKDERKKKLQITQGQQKATVKKANKRS